MSNSQFSTIINIKDFSKVITTILISFVLLVISPVSTAGSKTVPIEGMHYTINASIMDNLNALTGKRVTLTLDGGKVLTGTIKSVGSHLIHLEKNERKEFFDSLIRIENIQAIEAQFRKYQR